jgi:hypothetical protein
MIVSKEYIKNLISGEISAYIMNTDIGDSQNMNKPSKTDEVEIEKSDNEE